MTQALRHRLLTGLAVLLSAGGSSAADNSYFTNNPKTERDYQLADLSRTICAFHFITGADLETVLSRHIGDGNGFSPEATPDYEALVRSARIDPVSKIVRVSDGTLQAASRYYGDQGCVILPDYRDDAFFSPRRVRDPAAAANGPDWPDGGLLAQGRLPRGYNAAELRAARDVLCSGPQAYQFAVVHRGQLLLEHYAPGLTRETPVQNWSMGKSILGTLIGVLAQQRALRVEDFAPIPEWNADPADPRARIRIIDLMRMSSGLRCVRSTRPDQWQVAWDDNVYAKAIDITRLAITRPVVAPPNLRPNYSNCDMQSLGYIIRRTVEGRGQDYLSWPYRALYDRLGMSGMVSEVDTYGNFHLTGYDFGTARDWAKLGLLYLNDGVWRGERILPAGWTRLVSTPAPAFSDILSAPASELAGNERNTGTHSQESLLRSRSMYGATFWLNSHGSMANLPRDAFMARGGLASTSIMVPSRDLVIVILTGNTDSARTRANITESLTHIMNALPVDRPMPSRAERGRQDTRRSPPARRRVEAG
jgi:CubicO group peptidase (beta-lactamase class C family)